MGLLSRLIDSFKPPEPPPVPVISPEKLAEILKSDATLKKEWYRLCPLLPVAHPCLPLWESLVNKGLLDVGSVYVRIFDLWLDSANVENPPNIPKLSEALDSLHFYNAEKKLKGVGPTIKYPENTSHVSELKREITLEDVDRIVTQVFMNDPAIVKDGCWEELCKIFNLPKNQWDTLLTDHSFGDVSLPKILSICLSHWITDGVKLKENRRIKDLHGILSNLKNLSRSRDLLLIQFDNDYWTHHVKDGAAIKSEDDIELQTISQTPENRADNV